MAASRDAERKELGITLLALPMSVSKVFPGTVRRPGVLPPRRLF